MRALVTVALAVSLVSTSLALLCPSRSSSPLSLPSSSSSSSSSRRAHLTRRRRQWATTPPSPDDLDAVMGFEPDTLPPRRTKRKMAWPFQRFDAPPLLDGTLACDCGFDPFRIAKSQKELFALREAEIKHARLAMLAAVGWPASELTHYTISKVLGLNDLLADNERAPSVLNGGLQVPPTHAPPPPFPPFSPVLLTFVVFLTFSPSHPFSPSPSHAGAPFRARGPPHRARRAHRHRGHGGGADVHPHGEVAAARRQRGRGRGHGHGRRRR
jgi:hypothetical protein